MNMLFELGKQYIGKQDIIYENNFKVKNNVS